MISWAPTTLPQFQRRTYTNLGDIPKQKRHRSQNLERGATHVHIDMHRCSLRHHRPSGHPNKTLAQRTVCHVFAPNTGEETLKSTRARIAAQVLSAYVHKCCRTPFAKRAKTTDDDNPAETLRNNRSNQPAAAAKTHTYVFTCCTSLEVYGA